MRRLKTVRRPPIYPKTPGHLPCSSLTHPLPLSSRRPSVSFGGFGLRNSLIPILTLLGPLLAFLVTGSFIIETVFSVPGIGRLFVQGIFQRDYGLIMGLVLFYSFAIAVINLVVDLLYAVVDPRVRYR